MAKKNYFQSVDLRTDFPLLEKKVLKDWYKKSGVHEKYLQKNKNSKKYFSFLDGPITANNPMGIHHAWGRTYKDLWQRYKNMQGFKQRFQNGFDCQGLWVEVEVEKELGLKSKKDIENLVPGDVRKSIAKFVELCKKRVYKYADIQTEQSKRLGYFADWDNSYYTLSNDNNYMIWHFLKKCHEKGLIYKGRDSVPWCPRCGTAISQHEMLTEDYKEATHDSVYVQYPISGRKNEFLLAWTTTPWTLLGNIALAIDADKNYVLASGENENKYYLGELAAKRLGLRIEGRVKGEKLVGLEYTSPFDDLPQVGRSLGGYKHRVVASDAQILPITEEEGTGIVHIASGAGAEDFKLGKKLNLPVIELIDEEANYISGLGGFSGKNAKKHPEIILNFLRENSGGKYLFSVVSYTHRYPACWRCKTELVWRVVEEWYIAIDPVRRDMKEVSKRIKWMPGFGLKRELDWLDSMHDWLISKKRYWGLTLPIWECRECGNFEIIGSEEELKEKAVEGWKDFVGHSPHRPWVDGVKIKCSQCSAIIERIPDVGNPWLDAGIVAYSTISKDNKSAPLYLEDRREWLKWFPVDFITESFPGQFKNWFYSLIAMSTVLENQEPFKRVLGFATLLAEDGRPMHKSWGNAIEFNEGADKIGVDVMRWLYVRQNPRDNLLFGYNIANEVRRRFFLKVWNSYNFFVTYANLENWQPHKSLKYKSKNILDKWILARLSETINTVTKNLEDFNAYLAASALEEFVEDLSNWYIRRSRGRSKEQVFFETLHFVLVDLAKLLAPFMPFAAEEIYKNLTKEESVHLVDWSKSRKLAIDEQQLIKGMQLVREVVEKGHAERKAKNIPVRQPLSLLKVTHSAIKPQEDLVSLIKEELNIKEVKWTKANNFEVNLDTQLSAELKKEGEIREIIRKIQVERKKLGTALDEEVVVFLPEFSGEFKEEIKQKAQVKMIKKGSFKVVRMS